MFILLFLLFLLFPTVENSDTGKIELKINNLKNKKGALLINLFARKEGFPDDPKQSIRSWKMQPSSAITLSNIPNGAYALVVMHDEDGDNAMTYNYLNIPKEGFGFSGYRARLLERPDFKKALFSHRYPETLIDIQLRY